MRRIFISYRRSDSQAITERIEERLRKTSFLRRLSVFKDISNIKDGNPFPADIIEAASRCDTMLVIIGQDWLNARDSQGKRRLDNHEDWVRREIEIGLVRAEKKRIRLIPVLVNNAVMPGREDLPTSLQALTTRDAAIVRNNPDFETDVNRLIASMGNISIRRWVILTPILILLIISCIIALVINSNFPDSLFLSTLTYTPTFTHSITSSPTSTHTITINGTNTSTITPQPSIATATLTSTPTRIFVPVPTMVIPTKTLCPIDCDTPPPVTMVTQSTGIDATLCPIDCDLPQPVTQVTQGG